MPRHESKFRMVTSSSDSDISSSISNRPSRMQGRVRHVTPSTSRLHSLGDSDFTELRCSSLGTPQTSCSHALQTNGTHSPLLSSNLCYGARESVGNVDFIELDLNANSVAHSDGEIGVSSQTPFGLYHSLARNRVHRPSCEVSASRVSVSRPPVSLEDTCHRSSQNNGFLDASSCQVSGPLVSDPKIHLQGCISQEAPERCVSEMLHSSTASVVSPSSSSLSIDRIFRSCPADASLIGHASVLSQDPSVFSKSDSNQPLRSICDDSALTDHSSMVLQTSDLATGGSLICTVVNILRGLRLLDRCGLEDLCASLYGLQRLESHPHISNSVNVFHLNEAFGTNNYVTRSSSFTSPALISPRRSLRSISAQKSFITCVNSRRTWGCIAHFVLACSLYGSSFPPTYNRFHSWSMSQGHSSNESCADTNATHLTATSCLRSSNWKRGCSSNLVTLLSSGPPCGQKRSSVAINRLLTGRFFPGPNGWRIVWPHASCSPKPQGTHIQDLCHWISCWIRRGAVIVLAEFQHPSRDDSMCDSHLFDKNGVVSELIWRHRLVYGITRRNEIFLSNPAELVPVEYIHKQLSLQTTIHLDKRHLAQLWHEHNLHHVNPPTPDPPPARPISNPTEYDCCSGDFSLLACQQDRRWNEMNVLGQVLQTLRGMENERSQRSTSSSANSTTSVHSTPHTEDACLSPTIVIPSSQSPGFSVFLAKSDWKLVHALYQPVPWLE